MLPVAKQKYLSLSSISFKAPPSVHRYFRLSIQYSPVVIQRISESSWLRHFATSRKHAGSIPDEVTGFFN
jgi:hypothetical protein